MSTNRRQFLQAILTAGVAPAFIGSKVLMPVRLVTPSYEWELTSETHYGASDYMPSGITLVSSGCYMVSENGYSLRAFAFHK